MSNRTSTSLSILLALGAGALLGLSAASQKDRLPALGKPRTDLAEAEPFPLVEIGLGVELAEAGGRLRQTVEQVPEAIRRDLGFSPAHLTFREDVNLDPKAYVVRLRGLEVARGTIEPNRLLALHTLGGAEGASLPGETVTEPATGQTGAWITEEDAGRARLFGHDILEPGFVFALHVDTVLRRHLYELLTREETYRLLDRAKQQAPKTVEELSARLEVGLVQRVLQNLLREQVSLRDLPFVLELLSDAARSSQDVAGLTEAVRRGLSRQLSAALADEHGVLHALPLGPRWEQLRNARRGDAVLNEVASELRPLVKAARDQGLKPVLVAPAELRAHVRSLIERELTDLPVLAEHEVDGDFRVEAFTRSAVHS